MRTVANLFLTLLLFLLTGVAVAAAEPPAKSAVVGQRGGARDATSLILGAKVHLVDSDLSKRFESGLSLRPKLLIGDYLEARLPVSLELAVTSRSVPFISVGAAFNTDEFGHMDPMLGFGTDVALS